MLKESQVAYKGRWRGSTCRGRTCLLWGLPCRMRSLKSWAAFLLLMGTGAACGELLSCFAGALPGDTLCGTGGGLAEPTPAGDRQQDVQCHLQPVSALALCICVTVPKDNEHHDVHCRSRLLLLS